MVTAGEGARFPAAPFNATIWATGAQPAWVAGGSTAGNFEIVRVTAVSTDTLTITRAQETTTARTVVVGDQIAATVSALTLSQAPGTEIGYDQITSPVTVSSTTEATGTTVITCAAHTFDGGPVLAEFFSTGVNNGNGANAFTTVCLFESTTQIGRFCTQFGSSSETGPGYGAIRFTPTAGSHTYTVTAYRGVINGSVSAGAGGTGADSPAFVRFTKV